MIRRIMRRLASDATAAMIATACRAAGRLALALGVARLAGPEGFATFVLLVTIETIAGTMVAARWAAPITSFLPGRPRHRARPLADWGIRGQTRWLAVIAIPGLVLLPILIPELDVAGAAAFGAALVLQGRFLAVRAVRLARFEARAVVPAEVLIAIGGVAGAQAGAIVGDPVAGAWLGIAAASAVALWVLEPRGRIASVLPADDVERLTGFGRRATAGSLVNTVGTRLHPFLLDAAFRPLEVAAFGAATSLAGPLRLVTAAATGVLHPRFAACEAAGARSRAARLERGAMLAISILTLGLAVLGITAGPFLVARLMGPGFDRAATLLPWAAVVAGVAAIGGVRTVRLQAGGDAATPTRARLISAVAALALTLPLILHAGAPGAFIALLIGEAIFLVASRPRARRHARRRAPAHQSATSARRTTVAA